MPHSPNLAGSISVLTVPGSTIRHWMRWRASTILANARRGDDAGVLAPDEAGKERAGQYEWREDVDGQHRRSGSKTPALLIGQSSASINDLTTPADAAR
jgi:hypothetical protein